MFAIAHGFFSQNMANSITQNSFFRKRKKNAYTWKYIPNGIYKKAQRNILQIIKHLVYTYMDTSYVLYDILSRPFKRSH